MPAKSPNRKITLFPHHRTGSRYFDMSVVDLSFIGKKTDPAASEASGRVFTMLSTLETP
ncbi:MAG: hypothetical protein JRJ86_17590 [Deltaproteobacteria bacterium]|nr:hypothetical protein [Deltaproteobacteria bacterium]